MQQIVRAAYTARSKEKIMVTTTTAVYTVQVISLRCIESLELDGDDIELKFDGNTIWSSGKLKMHPRPTTGNQIRQIDFANGKIYGIYGWMYASPFDPDGFVFKNMVADSNFELCERDALGDEALAKSPVSTRDAGHGNISIVFAKDGARYVLTYCVEV
jgi:hypothetical protein